MPRRSRGSVGAAVLLDAAADLFANASFAQLCDGVISARRVAAEAGVAAGTVTYYFPASPPVRSLVYRALDHALNRDSSGQPHVMNRSLFELAMDRLAQGHADAVGEIAALLSADISHYSPEGGNDARVESEEVALFVAAACAPHDPLAAETVREFCRPIRREYERVNASLLQKTGRRYARGVTGESFAVLQSALCDGFIWLRRFDRDAAPVALFAEAWMRLFEACTVPEAVVDELDYADALLPLPPGSNLDPDKRDRIARAAVSVYQRRGWEGLTVLAVSEEAEVARQTVMANFCDRNGLAAAIWAQRVPNLREAARADRKLPVDVAITRYLERLAEIARTNRLLTGGLLEGIFAYTIKVGAPRPEDPADPRNLVPLHAILHDLIRPHSAAFRAGYADDEYAQADTSALLTNTALHLGMTRPNLSAGEVAFRVCDTMLAGMLRKRPPRRRERA